MLSCVSLVARLSGWLCHWFRHVAAAAIQCTAKRVRFCCALSHVKTYRPVVASTFRPRQFNLDAPGEPHSHWPTCSCRRSVSQYACRLQSVFDAAIEEFMSPSPLPLPQQTMSCNTLVGSADRTPPDGQQKVRTQSLRQDCDASAKLLLVLLRQLRKYAARPSAVQEVEYMPRWD